MEIRMVHRGLVLDETLQDFIRKRAHAIFSRLSHRVRAVRIQLEDMNGPRGGMDKRCVVLVTGDRGETCTVDVRDTRIRAAAGTALRIAARAVVRALQREARRPRKKSWLDIFR